MTAKIKQALIIGGLITAAVIAGLIVYGNYQRVLYHQALGASTVLTAEYKAEKEKAEIQILALNTQINVLTAEKDAALQSAAAAQARIDALSASLSQLQGETAALSPDALTGKLQSYVGDGNIALTGGGLFSLSRPGAENTYNLFLAGDSYRARLSESQSASSHLSSALTTAESTANAWAQKYALRDGEYQLALAAWADDTDALKHLRRSITGRRTKSFITGAALGVASVLIFQLAKGK